MPGNPFSTFQVIFKNGVWTTRLFYGKQVQEIKEYLKLGFTTTTVYENFTPEKQTARVIRFTLNHKSGLSIYINQNSKREVRLSLNDSIKEFDIIKHRKDYQINGVIIPKKTINELYKLLSENSDNIEIEISSNKIIFYIGKLIFISKLIDGTFPDYKRVIPKNNNEILNINRSNLLSAVDRVSTIVNEKSPVIKFKLLKDLVNLSTFNNDNSSATEDIQAKYQGKEIEIGFNSRYIMDILDNLNENEIQISFHDNSSPIIAKEKSNPDLIYVLMPMRV